MAVNDCKKLKYTAVGHRRRDAAAARRKTFISVVLHKFSRTDTNMSRKRPSNTTVLAVADYKKLKYTAVGHRRWDAAGGMPQAITREETK